MVAAASAVTSLAPVRPRFHSLERQRWQNRDRLEYKVTTPGIGRSPQAYRPPSNRPRRQACSREGLRRHCVVPAQHRGANRKRRNHRWRAPSHWLWLTPPPTDIIAWPCWSAAEAKPRPSCSPASTRPSTRHSPKISSRTRSTRHRRIPRGIPKCTNQSPVGIQAHFRQSPLIGCEGGSSI